MANFFSKKAPITKPTVFNAMNAKAGPSEVRSDFSKTFKPFVIKKDVKLAPINNFLNSRSKSKGKNVVRDIIAVDDDIVDDVVMADPCPATLDVSAMSTKGLGSTVHCHTRIDTSLVREVTIYTIQSTISAGYVASSTPASSWLQDVQLKFYP